MLLLASILLGSFIIGAVLSDGGADDDDHFDGGMLIPAQNPIQ